MSHDELIDNTSHQDDAVIRFEQMLKDDSSVFFDLHTIEYIMEHYIEQRNFDKALSACNHALYLYPFSDEVRVEKAKILCELGNLQGAWDLVLELEKVQPYNVDVKFIKANLLQAHGELEQAANLYHEILDQYEEPNAVLFQLGIVYKYLEKPKRAFHYFKKFWEQHPDDILVMNIMLECCTAPAEIQQLAAAVEQLIDVQPYQKYHWYFLGMVQNELRQFDAALKSLDYALVIDENFGEAHFALGHVYMNLQQYETAYDAYRKSWLINKHSPEINCHLGACLEKMGQYETAMHYYRKASQLDNNYADAWYGMGMCLLMREKWYEAIHFFKRAVKISPKNADFLMALAEAEYRIGNVISSLDAYKKASDYAPTHPDIWLNWSFIYYEQGEKDMAVGVVLEGLDEIPDNAELHYRAVCYLIGNKQFKEAMGYLETALTLDFEQHKLLFEFFPNPDVQRALLKVIDQFR